MLDEIQKFIEYLKEADKTSSASIANYHKKLVDFAEFFKDKSNPKDLTVDDLNRFLNDVKAKGYSIQTYNLYVSSIKILFKYLSHKYNIKNIGILIKNEKKKETKQIADENILEFLKKIENIDDERKTIFLLYIVLGLNLDEISNLQKKDVTINNNHLTLKLFDRTLAFYLADRYLEERLKKELKDILSNSKKYLFETSTGNKLTLPNFTYLFREYKKYITEECESILNLKSGNLLFKRESEIDEDFRYILGKRYSLVKFLAQSENSQIYCIKDLETNINIVIKILRKDKQSKEIIENFKDEYKILKSLSHSIIPNVYEFNYLKELNRYYFTMEYLEYEKISKITSKISFKEAIYIMYTILDFLIYIKSKKIEHHDINPNNILFRYSNENRIDVKLIDFGLSTKNIKKNVAGTSYFIAPEILQEKNYSNSADLYSLGITIYNLLSEKFPFAINTFEEYLKDIRNRNVVPLSKYVPNIPKKLEEIIHKLIDYDPKLRYGDEKEILSDLNKYFKSEISISSATPISLSVKSPNFIGRENELQRLNNIFHITFSPILKTKENSIVLISGEKGIGKRRLINEFASGVSLSDIALTDITTDKLFLEDDDSLGSIEKYLVSRVEENKKKITTGLDNIHKTSLIKRLSELLYKEVAVCPKVIMIFNAELIKKELLILFRFFLEEMSKNEFPYMLVFIFNSSEEKINELTKTIENKQLSHSKIEYINLPRLSKEESSRLIISSLNLPIHNNIIDYVFRVSGGNPGYITSLLHYLHEKSLFIVQDYQAQLIKVPEEKPESISSAQNLRIKAISIIERKILYAILSCEFSISTESLFFIVEKADLKLDRERYLSCIERLINCNFVQTDKNMSYDALNIDLKMNEQNIFVQDEISNDTLTESFSKSEIKNIHLGIATFIEENPQLSISKEHLANHLLRAGDEEKAIDYYLGIGGEYYDNGMYSKAKKIYELIISSLRAIDSNKKEIVLNDCTLKLGEISFNLGEFARALKYFSKIKIEGNDIKKQIYISRMVGTVKNKQGNFKEALPLIEKSLKLAVDSIYEDEIIEAKTQKVSTLFGLAQYDEANKIIKEVLDNGNLNESNKIKLYNQSGLVSFYQGNFNEASSFFKLSMDYSQKANNPYGRLNGLTNIGLVYLELMDYKSALNHFEKAVLLADELSDILTKSQILLNIGSCYLTMGVLGKSLEIYSTALTIFNNLDKPRETEIALVNISLIYSELTDTEKATKYSDESIKLSEERGNKLISASAYSVKGDISFNLGKYEDAKTDYVRAYDIFKEINAKVAAAEALLNLAVVAEKMNQYESVDEYTNSAISLSTNKLNIMVGAYALKAKIALLNKDYMLAKKLLENIENIEDEKLPYNIRIVFYEIFLLYYFEIGAIKALAFEEKLIGLLNKIYDNIPERFYSGFMNNPRIKSAENAISAVKIKSGYDANANMLEQLLKINLKIQSLKDVDEIFDVIIDSAILLTDAKRGFILLKSGDSFVIKKSKNISEEILKEYAIKISSTIFRQTIEKDKLFNIENAFAEFQHSESVQSAGLKSVISFPIAVNREVIGVIYLDDPTRVSAFEKVNRQIMQTFASQISIAISNYLHLTKINQENKEIHEITNELSKKLKITQDKLQTSENQFKFIRRDESNKYDYSHIITQSSAMRRIFDVIDKVKDEDVFVLITGESGVGKELIARAIHFNGTRKNEPFFAENCGAISENILESELFGYVKGAFTDAHANRTGILEAAGRGSIFLDEIGELSQNMQKKFLRVLEEKKIRRVGGNEIIQINARIISATNRNLEKMVEDGTFREDLYYRINVINIKIPPLRERKEDIPLLVEYFVGKYQKERKIRIDKSLIKSFSNYEWPGNIRELENEVLKLIAITKGDTIDGALYEDDIRFTPKAHSELKTLKEMERITIEKALIATGQNKSEAAKILGISLKTLNLKMQKWGKEN